MCPLLGVEMSYIKLHSSVFKSFMPKGEESLFVDITVKVTGKGPVVEND